MGTRRVKEDEMSKPFWKSITPEGVEQLRAVGVTDDELRTLKDRGVKGIDVSEQNGAVPDMRNALVTIGETLLIAKVDGIIIEKIHEWLVDDEVRLEIIAVGRKTQMRFTYRRYRVSDKWGLIEAESEPA
jgi:hypothetical protein